MSVNHGIHPPTNNMLSSTAQSKAPATCPLEELSWDITKNASVVSQYLQAHDLPQPTLDADGPATTIPKNSPLGIQRARQNLIESSLRMFQLAVGPSEFLPNLAVGYQHLACLQWLCRFDIFHLVPLRQQPEVGLSPSRDNKNNGDATPTGSSGISYRDLARRAGVPEQVLRSVARMAMTAGLLREPTKGHVEHSATSRLMAANADVHAWASYMCEWSAPTAARMADAHQRWARVRGEAAMDMNMNMNQTAYNVAFDTDLPFFEDIARDPRKTAEFAAYMRNVTTSEGVDVRHLVGGYDWAGLGRATVVDVGGSTGNAAVALSGAFPELRLVVQDVAENAEAGRAALAGHDDDDDDDDLGARRSISFQAHDFMGPQPVRGADVYLLRMILHDWPDEQAVVILRNVLAAMDSSSHEAERGSRLLIMDTVLPAPGELPGSVERVMRVRDLTMMQSFNSRERDLDDWRGLLAAASPLLELVAVVRPFGSAMSVLEVVARPDPSC